MDVADMMQNQDQFYTFGRGKSYGVEFYVAKTTGNCTDLLAIHFPIPSDSLMT